MWPNMEKIIPESQPKPEEPIPSPEKEPVTESKPNQVPEYSHLPDHDLLDDEDFETDNLFALMSQIKNCKENNKNLSDEERRQNAEEIMNKLAGMMDLGSDDDDEDENQGYEKM